MKHIFSILGLVALLTLSGCLDARSSDEASNSSKLETGSVPWPGLIAPATMHVEARLPVLETTPIISDGVLFLGDSITEGAPLSSMFPNLVISNHGIGWDTTEGVLLRLGQVTRHSPDRLFLLIGTNDTNYTQDPNRIHSNILDITSRLNADLPDTELYVISVLPREARGNAVLTRVNAALGASAAAHNYVYLDLASAMRGPSGEMNPTLSDDNLHLNAQGYSVWEKILGNCIRKGCPEGL